MWSGTCDYPHHSLARPSKLWNEIVDRLHQLRRQHWQQTSFSSVERHLDLDLLHSSRYPCPHQTHTQCSHRRHQDAARTCSRKIPNKPPQSSYHPRSDSPNVFAGRHQRHLHPSSRHDDDDVHQRWPDLYDSQHPQLPKSKQRPYRLTQAKLITAEKDKAETGSVAACKASQKIGLPGRQGAKPMPSATAVPQDRQNQRVCRQEKGMKRFSPAWIGELLPVPSGFVSKSDSKILCQTVEKHVESYICTFKQSSSTNKDYNLLQPSPIIRAGSMHHFKPPNLGQRDFENWMRKHRQKKSSKSGSSSNIAFGRSVSCQRSKRTPVTKTEAKNDTSFIKCMRGKLNARREVLKAIQDYHINAEARAQLEKRASDHLNCSKNIISLFICFVDACIPNFVCSC